MWSIGTPVMLVELVLTSKPCHDLIQSRVGNFKKNYNWGAVTLNGVHLSLLDSPRQGDGAWPRVFSLSYYKINGS